MNEGARPKSVESRPGSLSGLTDDELGPLAVSLAVADVKWVPDVVPAVMDRISRDAVAYPEQFDRRPAAGAPTGPAVPPGRSTGRMLGRVLVIGVVAVILLALALVVATVNTARAAGATDVDLEAVDLDFELVAGGFDEPVFVTSAGDGSGELYVVEQTGRIRVIAPDGSIRPEPFLDLSDSVSVAYEQGLLGLAFHPDYAADGRLFVDYTRSGDGATVVSELRAVDGAVDRTSERELLVIEQPFANHNGGMLAFDGAGYLLIGTGDGGSGGDPLGAGQDPTTLLGKLLRIDVDDAEGAEPYAIPADNGFVDDPAYRPEIHAVGLRNPWRFSVDPLGGHIYIGDVGQGAYEEVSVMPAGAGGQSFGWNVMEGPVCFSDDCQAREHVPPAISYPREGGCSVIGGYVYRGAVSDALAGVYVYGDYCTGLVWGADAAEMLEGPVEPTLLARFDGTLVSFGVDDAGEVYAVDQGGNILHLIASEIS
jgi:glucose/arabinose dehydrogenase